MLDYSWLSGGFVNGSLDLTVWKNPEMWIISEKLKNTGQRVQTLYSLSIPSLRLLNYFEGRILPIEHCIEDTQKVTNLRKNRFMVQPNDKVFKKCNHGSEALTWLFKKVWLQRNRACDLYQIFVLFQTPCLPEPLCRTQDWLLPAMPLPQMMTV